MGRVKHDQVLSLIGICYDENARHLQHIVMEKMDGDLLEFLKKNQPKTGQVAELTMLDLLAMCTDVASACKYLEECKLVHRDIAARNCLFKDISHGAVKRIVKICDFGLSRDINDQDYYRMADQVSKPIRWMSPESIDQNFFTAKSDVWAFG